MTDARLPVAPEAVAVSGGGDSLALMFLLADWARSDDRPPPTVLTVDHGLRKGSLAEARNVAKRAKAAGLAAHVLRWRGAKPKGDIEAAAREARYRLMGAWCRAHGVKALYLAHTLEDQAETFLLRLGRGSGIDGLSAMSIVSALPIPKLADIALVRPLLAVSRMQLRDFLRARGETWIEDSMNADVRFARVRLRAAWPVLEDLGLTASRIAAGASHLARARAALERDARTLMDAACRFDGNLAYLDSAQLAKEPEEIGLRVLAAVLMRVSGRIYRPRFDRLTRLYLSIREGHLGGGRTLHGCRIAPKTKKAGVFGDHTLSIFRERGDRRRPASARKGPAIPRKINAPA